MGNDEAALVRLWREKRGEAEPEDLSGNLIVQLGVATEALNRSWYERNTGRAIKDIQRRVKHSAIPWMAATLDGIVEETGAVFESKFMLPWSFSEEAAAEKYMAQLQHNMWVTNSRLSVLSIITGGGKWVEISIPLDPLYLTVLVAAAGGRTTVEEWEGVTVVRAACIAEVASTPLSLELIRAVGGGWQLRVCQEWFSLFGGMVMLDLRRQPSPLQLVVFAAAGPAGGLCLLLLFLVLNPYRWVDLLQVYRPGPALVVVGTFGATLNVVVNLLPMRTDPMVGTPSDGFVIRQNLARLRKAAANAA